MNPILSMADAIPLRPATAIPGDYSVSNYWTSTGGATTKRMLATGAEIRTVPQDEFLIRLPENPKPAERLNRLPE